MPAAPIEERVPNLVTGVVSVKDGHPQGSLNCPGKVFRAQPLDRAREQLQVKRLRRENKLHILAHSPGYVDKERGMRIRRLKRLIQPA